VSPAARATCSWHVVQLARWLSTVSSESVSSEPSPKACSSAGSGCRSARAITLLRGGDKEGASISRSAGRGRSCHESKQDFRKTWSAASTQPHRPFFLLCLQPREVAQ